MCKIFRYCGETGRVKFRDLSQICTIYWRCFKIVQNNIYVYEEVIRDGYNIGTR